MAIEIATYLSPKVITNGDIEHWRIPRKGGGILSAEDVFDKVGVTKRYRAGTETVLDMAKKAAILLPSQPTDADFVFFSTSYPNGLDNAGELSESLGLKPSGRFNVHRACSGFSYILAHIEQNPEKFPDNCTVLIAASEKYSPTLLDLETGQTDPSNSATIFSDGSVITKFRLNRDIRLLSSLNYQFPEEASTSIRMPIDYSLVRGIMLDLSEAPIPTSEDGYFRMDGKRVYEAVRQELPDLILAAIEKANLNPNDIALVIPHQASSHMLGVLERRLPQLQLHFYHDLAEGNLSSASIPKALGKAMAEGKINKGDKFVMAGFGAGLFASVVVAELG